MIDLEEGKRLRKVMDKATGHDAYRLASIEWHAWAVTFAHDLIEWVERLSNTNTMLNGALGICEKERDTALKKVEGLKNRLNSPRIWTEADEAAFRAMPKEDWSCLDDDDDETLDDAMNNRGER